MLGLSKKGEDYSSQLAAAIEFYWKGVDFSRGNGVPQDQAKATEMWKEAIKLLEKPAKHGDVHAQCWLGDCYYNGYGVPNRNHYVKAVEWYLKATAQGHAGAQYMMGRCYYNGYGVTKNISKAIDWLTKATAQGHAGAEYMMGRCYYNGYGVKESSSKAVELYIKAAVQGHAMSQFELGNCYFYERGTPRDIYKAKEWYTKAAENGIIDAQFQLGFLYLTADDSFDNPATGSDNPYGKEFQNLIKSHKWYMKAAEGGHADAQFMIGSTYLKGSFDIPQDYSKAIWWLKKAAKGGCDAAKKELSNRGESWQ